MAPPLLSHHIGMCLYPPTQRSIACEGRIKSTKKKQIRCQSTCHDVWTANAVAQETADSSSGPPWRTIRYPGLSSPYRRAGNKAPTVRVHHPGHKRIKRCRSPLCPTHDHNDAGRRIRLRGLQLYDALDAVWSKRAKPTLAHMRIKEAEMLYSILHIQTSI